MNFKSPQTLKHIAELINSPVVHSQLERYSEKSAQPGFNLVELKKTIIPDISLSEQNKIAEKILKRKEEIKILKDKIKSINKEIKEDFLN